MKSELQRPSISIALAKVIKFAIMEIKSLHHITTDELFTAFQEAFRDYERQWNKIEFKKMIFRRGYVPELSFGAFDGETLVSFTLNGIGQWLDKKTAYDTGTGTLAAYRGRGLATKIFEESLPYLEKAGVEQYLLEVLQHNTKAISVYQQLGFEVSREFSYFSSAKESIKLIPKSLPHDYNIQEISIMPELMMRMWDFSPSWQNSIDAINRKPGDFKIRSVFQGKELIGYGIIEPMSGDIPQIAVQREYRRRGFGTTILRQLLLHNEANVVKLINVDDRDTALLAFLKANNILVSGKQFEMMLPI